MPLHELFLERNDQFKSEIVDEATCGRITTVIERKIFQIERCAHDVAILKEFSQMPNHVVSFLGDRMTWSEKNHILTERTVLSASCIKLFETKDLSSWRRLHHQAR